MSAVANSPIPVADVLNAEAPSPSNVKLRIPFARVLSSFPSPFGTVTQFHFFTESARSPNGFAILFIDIAPSPESVFIKLPAATSSKAVPIDVNPLVTSPQDMLPNFCKASAKSPRPCIATYSDPAPIKEASPPSLPSTPDTVATSVSAPPIPVSPRLISPHESPLNLDNASANLPSP